ncbi:bidirectional sugar transporter SWEET12-like [Panicum miliaceum]|uniref:Bidirectional sugar transporter SWEET n=1 Tax=Panicum miliaceum TaxID=4540 RepID=A0A3L6SF79_PANMI|nr:bidirectional sugar transporter SWEET12-like [Panicum miliaceum]
MVTVGHPLVFAVGILGNILSFLVTLAPVPTFYRVYKKKSTESFQSVPYVVALLSAMLWLYYALLSMDVLLLSINAIACVVESVYLAIYLVYAPKDAMIFTMKLLCIMNMGLFGAMVAFLQFYVEGQRRVSIAGGIGAAFALAVFVAPLAIIRQVIRTKSVEFMPFWLSFFLTISAVAWFFYGLLLKDLFVAIPNVLGLLFGLAQMGLYFVYRNPKKNGAVSEMQVVAQAAADAEKEQQQARQQAHVAATLDADGEVRTSADDGTNKDDVVVDIMPPPPLPAERAPPLPLAPPAVIIPQPRTVEVV